MLSKIINKADRISEKKLILFNFCLAALVFAVNIYNFGSTDFSNNSASREILPFAVLSLPISTLILFTSLVARRRKDISEKKILLFQASALAAGTLAGLYYVLSLLFLGIPEDESFSWIVGLFTFLCVWPAYLFRRTLFSDKITDFWVIRYLHVIIFFLAFSLDLGVMYKINKDFSNYQQHFIQKK